MAAAVSLPRDRGDVERVARRAHRDAARRAVGNGRFADGHRELDSVDRALLVDHALCVTSPTPAPRSPPAAGRWRSSGRPRRGAHGSSAFPFSFCVRTAPPRRSGRKISCGSTPCCISSPASSCAFCVVVRVLEAPCVGVERDVDRLGDRRRQVDAELAEEVADDLPVDEASGTTRLIAPLARVVVVVVDVDHERRAAAAPPAGPVSAARVALSSASTTRVAASSGSSRCRSSSAMNS